MLCLSVRQPWAWAIVHGHKDVENRSWFTKHRGPLLIHACGRFDHHARNLLEMLRTEFPEIAWPAPMKPLPTGAIVGVVQLLDCVGSHISLWAEPFCWKWVLANAQPLPTPIKIRGHEGLWNVDLPGLDALVASLLERAR